MSTLQTLDRGLVALTHIARSPAGVSIAALAEAQGVARAIMYRIVETLEAHGLAVRAQDSTIRLGPAAAVLAMSFEPLLVQRAESVLQELADRCGTTAFLTVAHGERCTAAIVAEPADSVIRVGYRSGSTHSLKVGAGGRAILALRPPHPEDTPEIIRVREEGVAVSAGELEQGAIGVATGIVFPAPGGIEAALGIVGLRGLDESFARKAVLAAAESVMS